MAKDRVERDEEDLVRLYLTDIGQYPLLTKDDEVRLAKAIEGGRLRLFQNEGVPELRGVAKGRLVEGAHHHVGCAQPQHADQQQQRQARLRAPRRRDAGALAIRSRKARSILIGSAPIAPMIPRNLTTSKRKNPILRSR